MMMAVRGLDEALCVRDCLRSLGHNVETEDCLGRVVAELARELEPDDDVRRLFLVEVLEDLLWTLEWEEAEGW